MNLRFKLLIFILAMLYTRLTDAQNTDIGKFSLEAGPEYRYEEFRWSIAGNEQGTNPNILSELIFKPLNAAGFYSRAGYRFTKEFSLGAHYNRLFTYKGEVTDFDYDGDNRTDITTELYLQSNKGHMRTVGIDANYHFFDDDQLSLSSAAGYDFTRELFYLTNDDDPLLQSTYEANWRGPNLSLTGKWQPSAFYLGGSIIGRYMVYKASANWNLVETFQHPISFTHDANGHGFDYRLFFGYRLSDLVNLKLDGGYSNWKTKTGLDKLYQTDGQVFRARLNGALKKSSGIRLTSTFYF